MPFERVAEDPPFTHVGVDFAGPLVVCKGFNVSQIKAYICLFTCMATRAVHSELTCGMDVNSFLLAVRRFTSRRGLHLSLIMLRVLKRLQRN